MARIYISSTFEDLKIYREAVARALRKLSGQEIRGMEDYVSEGVRPLSECLADVDWCEIYVGIFAWRYGYVPEQDNPEKRSITEMEFRRARDQGKECKIFILTEGVPWEPKLMDHFLPEKGGKQITDLRHFLEIEYLVSHFGNNPEELAGLVTAAVAKWEKSRQPLVGSINEPESTEPSQLQLREVTHSVLLCCSPLDQDRVQEWKRGLAGRGIEALVSPKALFACDENAIQDLEKDLIRCHKAMVVISPASLDQFKSRSAALRGILSMMSDRTGYVGAIFAGVKHEEIPTEWAFTEAFEAPDISVFPGPAGEAVTGRVAQALGTQLAGGMIRTVGIPVLIVAMTLDERQRLQEHPEIIGEQLGLETLKQFKALCDGLQKDGVAWDARYSARREDWKPFAADGRTVATIVSGIASDLNNRDLARLRQRYIKVQHYPFDGVREATLRRIYRDVAQTGCIVIVDEVSMFHPVLREAFVSSQFFSSQQAAVVTVSPFDPGRYIVNQVLEHETRSKLKVAFERFEFDFDPQCEFAVGDERHLKRWLHCSLPETMKNLREARPDRTLLQEFAGRVGGGRAKRGIGDQIWPGGGQT